MHEYEWIVIVEITYVLGSRKRPPCTGQPQPLRTELGRREGGGGRQRGDVSTPHTRRRLAAIIKQLGTQTRSARYGEGERDRRRRHDSRVQTSGERGSAAAKTKTLPPPPPSCHHTLGKILFSFPPFPSALGTA